MNPQHKTVLLLLLGMIAFLGLTVLVYWSGLDGGFVLDDGANIMQAYIANPDWRAIVYTVTNNASGMLGRSVSMLSFVFTGLLYGLEPWGYKYHNLLLHMLNGVLLFQLLRVLLPQLDKALVNSRVLLVAGLATGLWLLHPLLVSTVLYAVQRMAQLSAFFTLLALLSYLQARVVQQRGWQFYLYGWLLFPLCTGLAILSKENGILIPVYVLAIELLAFRTGIREFFGNRRLAVLLSVFVLLPLLLGTLVLVFRFEALTNYEGRTFTLFERLLTQLHVLFFYVRMIFLPRISKMSLFHDDFPVTTAFDPATAGLLLLLLLACHAIFALRRSLPVVAFGLAWFLVSHLLESTVFPLEMVFEHRNYLASAGLLVLPVYAMSRLPQFKPLLVLNLAFIAIFAFMTATRSVEWGKNELFNEIAIQEHPGSGRALNNYVNFLTNRGEYEKTLEQLEKLTVISPLEAGVYLHLQLIQCGTGTRDEKALATARKLLGEYPVSVYAHNAIQNLVVFVVEKRCAGLTLDDLEALVETALNFPANMSHDYNLAYLQRARGLIAFAKGYYAQGYAYFRMAHEKVGNLELLIELMRHQLELGKISDAEETMLMVEQQNAAHFGIEQYQVDRARAMLENTTRLVEQAERQLQQQVPVTGAAPLDEPVPVEAPVLQTLPAADQN
jgi:tetratricopeptide (TPR) repeat protein